MAGRAIDVVYFIIYFYVRFERTEVIFRYYLGITSFSEYPLKCSLMIYFAKIPIKQFRPKNMIRGGYYKTSKLPLR